MIATAFATHGWVVWICKVIREVFQVNMANLKFKMAISSINAMKMKFVLETRYRHYSGMGQY